MKANYSSFIQRNQVHLSFISSLNKYKICHISFIPSFWCFKSSLFETQDKTTRNFRNSRPKVFLGKGVLKICSKFTREHPCWSVISIKVARELATLKSFLSFSKGNLKCKSLFNICLNHKILGSFYRNKKITENFRRKHGNRILQKNLNVIPNRLIPTTDFSHIVQIIWRYQFRIIIWRWNF